MKGILRDIQTDRSRDRYMMMRGSVFHSHLLPRIFSIRVSPVIMFTSVILCVITIIILFVGWLVVLRINVDLAVFQPYLDLEAGYNQSLKIQVARPGIELWSSCSANQELNHSTTAAPHLVCKRHPYRDYCPVANAISTFDTYCHPAKSKNCILLM